MSRMAAVSMVLVSLASLAMADDWPQFLGPRRDGISREAALASSWPAGGPPVLWKVSVGEGYSGPTISAGRVFVLDSVPGKQDIFRCLDLASGEERWRYAYDAVGEVSYPGSKSAITAGEARVYGIGPFGHFHCLDKSDGRVLWKKNLLSDYASPMPRYGVSQAPLLHGSAVIVAPQAKEVGVVAFDAADGRELWHSPGVGELGYGSPLITTIDGVEQLVMLSQDQVTGIQLGTGKILWSRKSSPCRRRITDPTPVGEGRFFLSGGYGAGSQMFQVRRQGGQWTVTDLFETKDAGSTAQHVIFWDGHLYLNSNDNRGGLMCMGLDGRVLWKSGTNPAYDIGHVLLAAEASAATMPATSPQSAAKLIALDGATGVLRMALADPAGYKELASAKVLDGKNLWAPMALSGGKLVLRDHKEMKCLDLRGN